MSQRAAASAHTINPLRLCDAVTCLEGVGPKRAQALSRLGIITLGDMLRHFPRRYEDRRSIARVADAAEGARITVSVRVVNARLVRLRGRLTMAEATVEDASGRMRVTWFNQGYLARMLAPATRVVLTGTVGKYKGLALKNPELEILSGDGTDCLHVGRFVPIYPMTDGLSQRLFREWVWRVLNDANAPEFAVPNKIRERSTLDSAAALRAMHFPETIEEAEAARKQIAFEELLILQALVVRQRGERTALEGIRHELNGPRLTRMQDSLPFPLTTGQVQAIGEILGDMASARPMSRLVQGDVGCGKTLVAQHAIAACVDGGHQAAMMAPTEVLAAQHFRTLTSTLASLGVRVALLTGASGPMIRAEVRAGDAHVIVGTHALFEKATEFRDLGLAIVDEQHRFGVGQRERLAAKGAFPDRLHLTATPIPRSLAMTLYGAMDLTIIRDLPPGRQPVATRIVAAGREHEAWALVREEVERGFQAYIVCPNIEATQKRKQAAAQTKFHELSHGALGGLRCALVHGRLSGAEKDELLEDFRVGNVGVLVSTTVIEVGVDAPRATVMVIEDAGSFGLTQLHQLRGRVGRSGFRSHCLLLGKPASEEAAKRLEILCATHDGFRIAEEDFALRGPGEVHGERQSGLSDLKAAQLPRDMDLLVEARRLAEDLFAHDPQLRLVEHSDLARALDRSRPIAV